MVNDVYHHKIIIWFALLFYVINISFCALCLILSVDIETNPWPFHRTCPQCNERVHIKRKVCSCGYIFSKKIRSITKVISPSVSTVNVEISDACSAPDITQTSGCALLSTGPIDVTIKSLDSISIELIDDTARDATLAQ